MYFTLAVSASTSDRCAELIKAAEGTDPRLMPIAGAARVAWRAPDGRSAIVRWGGSQAMGAGLTASMSGRAVPVPRQGSARGNRSVTSASGSAVSAAGTIWAQDGMPHARTSSTRIDPVYLAEQPGVAVLSDRAAWAAAMTGRIASLDPVLAGALLNVGYPLGNTTPFSGVRALACAESLRLKDGSPVRYADEHADPGPVVGTIEAVADALISAVAPLATVPVEMSLTGGKDSRLVVAALSAAGIRFRARTHGFEDHPDVIVAALIANRLGVQHVVTEPTPPQAADIGRAACDRARRRRDAVGVRERRKAGPAAGDEPGPGRRSRR